jgi:hypothetical protein
VSENRVPRRIFEPKGEEITGGWRKLHSEEEFVLFTRIIMIKPRRTKWARYVACMGIRRMLI